LGHFDELTWDHVLPDSWYPDSTPANLEKWRVPACRQCNEWYGELERDLLVALALCLDRQAVAASGITERVLRSIDPRFGRDDRDRAARAKRRERIIAGARRVDKVPAVGVLPNFGPRPNAEYPNGYLLVDIPGDDLKKLGVKLARGITYLQTSRTIDKQYEVATDIVSDEDATVALQEIEQHLVSEDRGPGLSIKRARVADDPLVSIFVAEIWGTLKLYLSVLPREEASNPTTPNGSSSPIGPSVRGCLP